MNLEKSLVIRIKCYGNENNFDVATSYNNLGMLYKQYGNVEKAKIYLEKSLSIRL